MTDTSPPFPAAGDGRLVDKALAALREVVDPEMSLNIVDVGLVYGLEIAPTRAKVTLTMTSAACPVAELIVADVEARLGAVLPPGAQIAVELVWEPPWTPERMSERARAAMGWE